MNKSVELSNMKNGKAVPSLEMMTVAQLKDYMRLHKIKGLSNPKATLIKLIIIYENHIKTSTDTIYKMPTKKTTAKEMTHGKAVLVPKERTWKDMFAKLKLRKNRKRDDYPLWSALYKAIRDESEELPTTDDKIQYMFETMYYFQELPKKIVAKYDATYYKKFLIDLEDYFFGLSDTLQREEDKIEWNAWKQEQLNNKTDIDDEPREVILPPITSWREDLEKIMEKTHVPLVDVTPPLPPKRTHIPKYEPPENYKEQEDIYNQYETYGEYGNRDLVFSTAKDYLRDLNIIRKNASYLDKDEFIKKIKAQIAKPSSSVLFDYLYQILLPVHRRQYEISLIYDENNDQLVHEDEVGTSSIEIIDEVSDIIARTQYSLEQDKYKQFLQDVLSIIDKDGKAVRMNIVKSFYTKYKFISAPKIKEMMDDNGIDTADELIMYMDEYLDEKKQEAEDAAQQKREKQDKARYEKERKQREADEKHREKQREKELERYQKMMDDEYEKDARERAKEDAKMQKMIDDLDNRIMAMK